MELLTKSRDELWEIGKKLKLEVPKNIKDDELIEEIQTEAIRQTIEIEEKIRLRLQEESRMRRDVAEVQAEAATRGIQIDMPAEPTLKDIIGFRKKMNIMIKEPKPSPETLSIEKSKKAYYMFNNREQEDMDVTFCPGGKYYFHLWPERVHILPVWLVGWLRKNATRPIYGRKTVPNPQSVQIGGTIETSGKVENKPRFMFEKLGPAPDDASFGVVLDTVILSSLEQPV